MGLDMYLEKRIYLGLSTHDDKFNGEIHLEWANKEIPVNIKDVSSVNIEVGYWRKANQIHKWFVDNVQDGEDDCKDYWVSPEKLQELLNTCKKVLEFKTIEDTEEKECKCAELLPTQTGFFFGSYEYDDWYFDQIEDTIAILEKIDLEEDRQSKLVISYYYSSSW